MIFLLATNNPGKAREIKPEFEAAGLTLITLADLGLNFEAKEEGQTYAHNATQKAAETATFLRNAAVSDKNPYAQFLSPFNIAVLADDSGFAIDALDGQPGVDAALFMGRETPYDVKCQGILDMLAAIPDNERTARFICNLVCIFPDESVLMAEGIIEGYVARSLSGAGGFGYDPVFYYPPFSKTMAEMSQEEKSSISHRGQATQLMIGLIRDADISNK